MKSITVGDMTKYSVRLVHFRSINVNKNLGQNEKNFWILWLRQVRLRSLVFDLEIILIFHPHYHTHSGNTSRPVNLAVVRWLVSNEDENEYGYDNGNEIED